MIQLIGLALQVTLINGEMTNSFYQETKMASGAVQSK
jgi:hypothetical protein